MTAARINVSTAFERSEKAFRRARSLLVLRMVVISALLVFTVETLLMLSLEYIITLPVPWVYILDGVFLVIILFPLNYYLILRPMTRQIDEHRRTHLELTRSHEILEHFFSISDVLIAYMDADFNFIRVNQVYADTDQRPAAEFVGKNHFDLFPNEENKRIFQDVVDTGKPFNIIDKPFEFAEHPERGVSYWDWSLLPVKSSDGRVIQLLLILNNVTSRKRAQIALTESERRFRAVFNQTFQHNILLDTNGGILLANQTVLTFCGITNEDVRGEPLCELPCWDHSWEENEHLQAAIQQAAAGEVVRSEHQVRSAAGETAVMDVSLKPLIDDNGKTVMLIFEARDITEKIRAEEALKHSGEENKRLYFAERRAHRLANTLRSAAAALSTSLDINTVMETLLEYLDKVATYSSGHVFFLDEENQWVVRWARGEETWPAADRLLGRSFEPVELSCFNSLVENRQPIWVPDATTYPAKGILPDAAFVRSWIAVPLFASKQIIGICVLEHTRKDAFSHDALHWVSTLTNQAAVAIQNARMFEQVEESRENLQALSRKLVEVQENERLFIAQELHDQAGQALASMMVGLKMIENDCANPAAVVTRSRELKQIADGVLEDLHRLSMDLRPPALDHLGLVPALRQHVEQVGKQNGLSVQFETVGKVERLPALVETAIYRIVQEALTNVVRHANATRVDILIERRNESLSVILEDNGVGFSPQAVKADRLGTVGMRERAEMLGGSLRIESSPGKGSAIFLEVPCPSES